MPPAALTPRPRVLLALAAAPLGAKGTARTRAQKSMGGSSSWSGCVSAHPVALATPHPALVHWWAGLSRRRHRAAAALMAAEGGWMSAESSPSLASPSFFCVQGETALRRLAAAPHDVTLVGLSTSLVGAAEGAPSPERGAAHALPSSHSPFPSLPTQRTGALVVCTSAASAAVGLVEDRPATALPTLAAVQASCAHKCALRPPYSGCWPPLCSAARATAGWVTDPHRTTRPHRTRPRLDDRRSAEAVLCVHDEVAEHLVRAAVTSRGHEQQLSGGGAHLRGPFAACGAFIRPPVTSAPAPARASAPTRPAHRRCGSTLRSGAASPSRADRSTT